MKEEAGDVPVWGANTKERKGKQINLLRGGAGWGKALCRMAKYGKGEEAGRTGKKDIGQNSAKVASTLV